ncbi:TraB/GumN family protein [soil metagenome]
MFSRFPVLRLGLTFLALASVASTPAASVWKVTGPHGGTIYLGGSIHGLDSTDYPLPSAYNRAFDATSALVIEDDPNVSRRETDKFFKSGFYSRGDSLKNHVDPRTYDYVRRVFRTVPEAELAKCKPWMLITMLWSGRTNELGVEAFLMRRARANRKPILGLESFREHADVLAGMSDKQAELVLLDTFAQAAAPGTDRSKNILSAWRRGDADAIARLVNENAGNLPTFNERLIAQRNRNWIPKIEGYLRERKTYFVVGGAAHMGGPNGVLALLKARGCRIEQL